MGRLPPALALLLLALPAVAASAGGIVSDPEGDQTAIVARSDSVEVVVGGGNACADASTDVTRVEVAQADGVATVRLVLADLSAPRLTCGGVPLDAARAYRVRFDDAEGAYAGDAYFGRGGVTAVHACNESANAGGCARLPHAFAVDGNAFTWTFDLASPGDEGWDLTGIPLVVRGVTVSAATLEPYERAGTPVPAARDDTGPLLTTF